MAGSNQLTTCTDASTAEITYASLVTQTDAAMSMGLNVAAILDPASEPRVWPKFGNLARTRGGGSLFIGTSHPDDEAVAPLLLPLQQDDAQLLNELTRIALESPAVIWVASPLQHKIVAAKLANKFQAKLIDGQAITLRYQDPRVLPELLSGLNADQLASFNDGVATWWWFDRGNMLCRNNPEMSQSPLPNKSPWLPTIALDEQQVEALLEASFIDRVLHVLQRVSPGAWQGLARAERWRLASRLIETASTWNLTSEFDCASYIAVALQHGPGFAQEPEWAEDMSAVKVRTLRFSDAIANWEQRSPNPA